MFQSSCNRDFGIKISYRRSPDLDSGGLDFSEVFDSFERSCDCSRLIPPKLNPSYVNSLIFTLPIRRGAVTSQKSQHLRLISSMSFVREERQVCHNASTVPSYNAKTDLERQHVNHVTIFSSVFSFVL